MKKNMDMVTELKQRKSVQKNVVVYRQCLLLAPTISAMTDVKTDSASVSVKLVLPKRVFVTRCLTADITCIDLGQVNYFRGIDINMIIISFSRFQNWKSMV